jgi:hypothetical protein
MQRKPADNAQATTSANQNSESAAIDARLIGVITANMKTPGQPIASLPRPQSARLQSLSFFQGAKAILGLIGLMIAAYLYTLLVKKEA